MKTPSILTRRIEKTIALSPFAATAWLAFSPLPASAGLTDIAPAPLANSANAVVKPNILMILDDSGSMHSQFMPDNVTDEYCKDNSNSSGTLDNCAHSDPPFDASAFNGLAYNPNVRYVPAVNADTTSRTSYSTAALWAAVPNDSYGIEFSGNTDLTQDYPDNVWCQSSSSSSDRTPPYLSGVCKHPLAIGTGTQTWTYPDGTFSSRQAVNNGSSPLIQAPFFYTIASVQWCQNKDSLGFGSTTCQAKRTSSYKYPKYGAISRTDIATNEVTTPYTVATATEAVCTGNVPAGCGCTSSNKRKSVSTTTATRTIKTRGARVTSDVTGAASGPVVTFSGTCGSSTPTLQNPNPSVTFTAGAQTTAALSYPKVAARTDCAGAIGSTGCSFTEEMTNFANWYAYYRTRMMMMKTASGLAFKTLNQNYRVGFITINPGSNIGSSKYLSIAPFEGAQRTSWYDVFYNQNPSPSTPLRQALARAGRYYAGKGPSDTAAASGLNRGMNDDPIQYSCQQNFAILSTDGLWNGPNSGPVSVDGSTLVGNPDGNAVSAPRPLLDGSNEQTVTNDATTSVTQAICTGSAAVLGTTCGCPANLKRVIQQTVVSTDTKTFVGGVQQGGTVNTTNTTYQTIFPTTVGVCDATQVGTQTPQSTVEIKWCLDNKGVTDNVTFADGQVINCDGCNSSSGFLIRQTNQRTKSVIAYDGGSAVTSFNVTSTVFQYSTNGTTWSNTMPSGGSCTSTSLSGKAAALVATDLTPVVNVNTGATVTTANFTIPGGGPTSATTSTSTTTSGTSNTLADVAQYYYITDLRGGKDAFGNSTGPATSPATTPSAGGDVSENNVKGQTAGDPQNDSAIHQHMTTFTVGLGVDGTLTYASDYKENPTGDFLLIKNGGSNWPTPVSNTDTTVDDLWHSGVNGRGKYLSARDPSQLTFGLSEALTSVNAVVGAAAAAATSNLEPVAGDNFAYIASYETVRWNGEVEARTIDLNTGAVSATDVWSAQTQLDTLTNATSPGGTNRKIYRLKAGATDAGTGSALESYLYSNFDPATEQINFKAAHVSGADGAAYPALTQWSSLDPTTQQVLAVQDNLVNFLRGDGSFEDNTANAATNRVFRDRAHVLGDIVNAQPVFVKKSSLGYTDANYATFQACLNVGGAAGSCTAITGTDVARPATVYISSNDGMLHALNGDTGAERWAFIPNILMPKMYRLADSDYRTAINHQWMVDGSPSVGDIFDGTKWRTVLIGGLNGGGRGYYALDVTDPAKPKGLWEFNVRTSGACTFAVNDTTDCDLGYSYGNPILTKLADGTWVVMIPSGYNNVNPGDGKGYMYVLNPLTGQIRKKIALCSTAPQSPSICPGDTTTPLGFARINNWVDDSSVNNTTLRVYGGDLQGNVWRIDADAGKAFVIAQLNDGAATPAAQPVTTKPELGQVTGPSGTADMVYVATGQYLGAGDTSTTQKQTIYAIKDSSGGTAPVTPIDARGSTVVAQTLADTTDATGAAVRTVTNTPVSVTSSGVDGWRVDLPVTGERVNVDMKLQLGTLIVGSNVPANNACNAGGFSFLNFFDYRTGSYIPSAGSNLAGQRVGNSLLVGINVVRLPNGKTVAIATTSDNQHPTLYPPFQSPNPVGRRVGWRELNE